MDQHVKSEQIVIPKSYHFVFTNFYSRILIKFFPGPEASEVEKIMDLREFTRKMLTKYPKYENEFLELSRITKEKHVNLINNLNRSTQINVILKSDEILRTAKAGFEALGYAPIQLLDGIRTNCQISDEHLFQVNKKVDALFGMILVRDE